MSQAMTAVLPIKTVNSAIERILIIFHFPVGDSLNTLSEAKEITISQRFPTQSSYDADSICILDGAFSALDQALRAGFLSVRPNARYFPR